MSAFSDLGVQVRPCTEADSPAIAVLSAQLGYPSTVEQILRRFAILCKNPSDHAVFVAVHPQSADIVGWLHVSGMHRVESDGYAEIGGLVVSADCRRMGIGHALMIEAEKWAAKNAYPSVRLRSGMHRQDEAHHFYAGIGYDAIRQSMMFKKDMVAVEVVADGRDVVA